MKNLVDQLKDMPEILSLREVADILQVSLMTLRRWDDKGLLKAFRPSDTQPRRYHKKDVITFLKKSSPENQG
ncbi:helix-turn-helix domain-containing protein [Patescibacteria group bacterium]|nr:helix-turn-helix domain-containing protein [Patescibacteria group bacterium]MBU1672863.1 helix-turn-helix domain-containing protein [Patescibacteria group bacterium]MBU1901584.1 helix-turn-helix domain-containing protein [Patescibacteria group bacterium]